MPTPIDVKILQISTDDFANLNPGQFGVSTELSVLGVKLWGGKDEDGEISQWLQLDQNARVKHLSFVDVDPTSPNSIVIGASEDLTNKSNSVLLGQSNDVANTLNAVIVGNYGGVSATKMETTVAVGNYVGAHANTTNSVYMGFNTNASPKTLPHFEETRNVHIGSYAGGSDVNFSKSILIGSNAGLEAEHVGVGNNNGDYVGDTSSIWNMIAIGDGAGQNAVVTSGTGGIFIGMGAGKDAKGYLMDGIYMGHGCLSGSTTYATSAMWKYYGVGDDSLFVGENRLLSEKFVVHSSRFGNTTPSMVFQHGRPINSSKLYGPMLNIKGNTMGASCLVVLRANTEYDPTKVTATLYGYDTGEYVQTGAYIDLVRYKHIILSASDGVFSVNTSAIELSVLIGTNAESTIEFVGDTAHGQGKLRLNFDTSIYDYSTLLGFNLLAGYSMRQNCIFTGDNLWGSDGRGRKIDIKTSVYVDGDDLGYRLITTNIEKIDQLFFATEWKYSGDRLPNARYTKGTDCAIEVYWPTTHTVPQLSGAIYAGYRHVGDGSFTNVPNGAFAPYIKSITKNGDWITFVLDGTFTGTGGTYADEINISFNAPYNTLSTDAPAYDHNHLWLLADSVKKLL